LIGRRISGFLGMMIMMMFCFMFCVFFISAF